MDKKYNHKAIESKIYQWWLKQDLFTADLSSKKPTFCIVLPPPNVTGQLHLGHAWDGTIQDVLIRYKRLQGFETLFVPGSDHAGIATQVKVFEEVKKHQPQLWQNLNRATFYDYAWKWKDKYQQIIHQQWAKLGLALDYTREKFTLDDDVSKAVRKVFVELYQKGMIYQGTKIVNWDPLLKTAISNIEVTYQEVQGKLYYLKYYLADQDQYLTVATTRPETIFADQALVVHPDDERYQKFIGQQVVNPVTQELLPVIADDYVDRTFGTGVMKCTPAHDFNDYQIGLKHNLAMPVCMDKSARVNTLGAKYLHQDRFVCRKNLITDLQQQNLVVQIEDYVHQIGFSQRTNVVVEPYLSKQWFIKMESVAQMICHSQRHKSTKVDFFPEFFEDQLLHWVKNIQDWCISRQLWWGHQIPVWYHKQTKATYVGEQPPTNTKDYVQDPDVLDTWFSSALWPLLTLNWPKKSAKEFKKFYPTSVLVTAYDILFFWVIRMMFMGLEFAHQRPFNHVLIHGLIRDEQGRKMSKSLNNGVDPIVVIEDYGADALRYFLISNSAPGQDLRFSQIKIEAAWNLINKLWNAARYVLLNITPTLDIDFESLDVSKLKLSFIDQWLLEHLNQLILKVETGMEKYDFMSVTHELANFIWTHYCSWYIELSKVNLQNSDLATTSLKVLVYALKQIIIMLHPFLPFVSEEIYQKFTGEHQSILLAHYSKRTNHQLDQDALEFVLVLTEVIGAVREIRNQFSLAFKHKIDLHINSNATIFANYQLQLNQYLLKLTNSEITSMSDSSFNQKQKVSKVISNAIIEVKSGLVVNKKEELAKLQKQLDKINVEIKRCENLLNNQQFLLKAQAQKIDNVRERLANFKKQSALIEVKIKELM